VLYNKLLQFAQSLCRGFENDENFRASLKFSLPPKVRLDFRDQVRAGGKA